MCSAYAPVMLETSAQPAIHYTCWPLKPVPKPTTPERNALGLTMLARHCWLPAASGPQQEEERVGRSRQRRHEAEDPVVLRVLHSGLGSWSKAFLQHFCSIESCRLHYARATQALAFRHQLTSSA